jgi:peptidoglycan/xylan/chitin deacetylase (PgdA/CDA1 family)
MTLLVSITFDDANESQFTDYYPILESYGLRATFFVITSLLDKKGILNYDQVKELYKCGNEIGSHTHTHPHLTKIPTTSLIFELKKSKEILRNFNCNTLAYPYGDYDERVICYTRHFYSAARGYYGKCFGINHIGNMDKYALKVIPPELLKNYSIFHNVHNGLAILVFHEKFNINLDKIFWITRNKRFDMLNMTSIFNLIITQFFKAFKNGDQSNRLLQFKKLCDILSSSDLVHVLTISEALKRLDEVNRCEFY